MLSPTNAFRIFATPPTPLHGRAMSSASVCGAASGRRNRFRRRCIPSTFSTALRGTHRDGCVVLQLGDCCDALAVDSANFIKALGFERRALPEAQTINAVPQIGFCSKENALVYVRTVEERLIVVHDEPAGNLRRMLVVQFSSGGRPHLSGEAV